jgi:uncharacterized protein
MLKSLLASLAMTVALASSGLAEETKMTINRTISISGHGEARVAPDLAILNLGVFTHADSAKAAVDGNSKNMAALFAALKAAGIADKDVQTANFSVNPRYDYGDGNNNPPKPNGFDATNSVSVIVRKIEAVGAVLDASVSAGSNQINGVSFSLSNPDPVMDSARKLAVADAQRKAKLYAEAAGVSLVDILTIAEGGVSVPQPVFMAQASMKERSADVPIAQGEQVISADVSIVWAFK